LRQTAGVPCRVRRDVTFTATESNGSATGGSDFVASPPRTITILAGDTSATLSVPIAADLGVENDETFKITLSGATNATIARAEATGTIRNDDGVPPPSVVTSFTLIDTKTDQVVDTVAVEKNARGPFRVKYSPDGLKLVTCDDQQGLANIISTKNLHGAQQVVTVGKTPFGIAFSADSKTALVSNHGDGTISVIDLTTSKVVNTFKAGTGIETLSYY